MIDPLTEELITPTEATRYYPRDHCGRKPHVSTVFRHMKSGVRGVVLESIRAPKRCTSREAIARFFGRLSEQTGQEPARTPAARVPDRRVEEELDRLGL